MSYRGLAILSLVAISLGACQALFGPPPKPTRTPRPTITPTPTSLPVTQLQPSPSPVIFLTATLTAPGAAASSPSPAGSSNLTPTARVFIPATTLTITNVLLVGVERDPARHQGAFASIQVVYSGGRAPISVFHDDVLQRSNPFNVATVCNGTLVHTIRLTSGDGQSISKKYYLSPITCPP